MTEKKSIRINLKCLRVKHQLSQDEMAKKIGCTRATYSAIENAKRGGRTKFWESLQSAFLLYDDEVSELKIVD